MEEAKKSKDFDVDEMLGAMKDPAGKKQESFEKMELTEFDLLDAQIDESDSISIRMRQKQPNEDWFVSFIVI